MPGRSPVWIPCAVAALMLVVAALPMPWGYYNVLRWVVAGISLWTAHEWLERGRVRWVMVMIFVAVLFNPLVPFRIGKGAWIVMDLLGSSVMTLSAIVLYRPTHTETGEL